MPYYGIACIKNGTSARVACFQHSRRCAYVNVDAPNRPVGFWIDPTNTREPSNGLSTPSATRNAWKRAAVNASFSPTDFETYWGYLDPLMRGRYVGGFKLSANSTAPKQFRLSGGKGIMTGSGGSLPSGYSWRQAEFWTEGGFVDLRGCVSRGFVGYQGRGSLNDGEEILSEKLFPLEGNPLDWWAAMNSPDYQGGIFMGRGFQFVNAPDTAAWGESYGWPSSAQISLPEITLSFEF